MSKSHAVASTAVSSATHAADSKVTSVATAAKRKAARLPPVIDRSGVALDSTSSSAASAVSLPVPTAGDTSAPVATSAPSGATSQTIPASALTGAVTTTSSVSATGLASAAPVDVSSIPLMNAPPTVTVPVPPAGFVPVRAVDLMGYRPMQSELASVPDAVYELQAFPNWTPIFGITAPSAAQLAQRLQVAAEWTALLAQSNAWVSYVKSQEGMAWKDALEVINSLKAPFQLASSANPSMLNQYPALNRLLGAQKVVAKRAVSSRKRNAAAVAAAAMTARAIPVAPAAATSVTAAALADAATPARVVTVQG